MALINTRDVATEHTRYRAYRLRYCISYIKHQGFTPIASDIPTDSCLYGKAAHTIICWNIDASDNGVVGGIVGQLPQFDARML